MGIRWGKIKKKISKTDPRVVIWYWGALEADFIRFYKLDIQEALDTMSWRKVSNLIGNLPLDSAYKLKLKDKKSRSLVEYSEQNVSEEMKKVKTS